jgi:hypothetical protein
MLTGEPCYPLRIPIKGPSSAEIRESFETARAWVSEWRGCTDFACEWTTAVHRLFGANDMPTAVVLADADALIRALGVVREYSLFQEMLAKTLDRFPGLRAWIMHRPMRLLELAGEWERLLSVVAWVLANPRCGFYLRQIDLPGVDTKFVEGHRAVLGELLDCVLPASAVFEAPPGVAGFARRYGFREKPERIRVRFLDRECAFRPERMGLDVTVDASAFAAMEPEVDRVFVTENEINFLAFPSHPKSLIVFGSGYGWAAFIHARWLFRCEVYYWGDLDSHGFSILDQLRGVVPHARSFLMDGSTFEALRHLCCVEPEPARRELTRLNAEERGVLSLLWDPQSGSALRLEQEKIPFAMIEAALCGLNRSLS